MGKGTFIATVALLVAVAGAIVAFAAYFKHRNCALYDDFDDEIMDDDLSDLDYYATQMDSDETDDLDDGEISDAVDEAAPKTKVDSSEADENPNE